MIADSIFGKSLSETLHISAYFSEVFCWCADRVRLVGDVRCLRAVAGGVVMSLELQAVS